MLRTVKSHRPRRLTATWLGVLASAALLTSGAWTIRGAAGPNPDSASLLTEFIWLFVVAFAALLIPFLLLARGAPRAQGPHVPQHPTRPKPSRPVGSANPA